MIYEVIPRPVNSSKFNSRHANNSKPFWIYLKSRKQYNIGIKKNGSLVCDSQKAEILLDQFQECSQEIMGLPFHTYTLHSVWEGKGTW